MIVSSGDLGKGDTLGRYEIIEKIAVGGMAEIYLGRVRGTAGFDKLVAIKRILPHVASDQAFVEMFLAEARLAATLRHPNIGDVFDVGADNGSYFLAMEFIHGQDVRTLRLETASLGKPIPLEIAVAIVTGIASALSYTHARLGPNGAPLHLVHRDVSPSNMLVSYDGAVKLVDFGIARAESQTSASVTRPGQLRGKIPYMSPEQCKAKGLDGRSDLFSLGTVLYELTTGQRPFDGRGDFDTLERIVHGQAPRPSEIVDDYLPALEAIVMRMLATKPGARYQTGESLLLDLEHLTSEHGLFVSAFTVGKYMREMFPEEAQQLPHVERTDVDDDDTNTVDPEHKLAQALLGQAKREAPRRITKNGMFAVDVTPAKLMDPAAPTPRPSDPSPEFRVVFRPAQLDHIDEATVLEPERPVLQDLTPIPTPYAGFDEYSTAGFGRTETSPDYVPPIDPIATRAADLLAEIDPDLIDDRDISLRTLGELVLRAEACWAADDLDSAVIAIDLVLSADRGSPGVLDLLAKNYPFMTGVYERFIGDRERTPRLSPVVEEPSAFPLDRRAAYLLSLVESSLTISQLLACSEMPTVEAYRHLSQLLLRKLVVIDA